VCSTARPSLAGPWVTMGVGPCFMSGWLFTEQWPWASQGAAICRV